MPSIPSKTAKPLDIERRELPEVVPLSKQSDDQLWSRIVNAETTKKVCDQNIKQAKAELLLRRRNEIQSLLNQKDEPYGTVTITIGNHQVVVDTKKKVEWDQKDLKRIYEEMLDDQQRPQDYIDVEYSVNETKFKSWDNDMRDYFREARTVQPGTISIKGKEEKE